MDEPQLNEDGTKTCPQCAEHVQGAALVCRFCGYRFDGTPAPVDPGETSTSGVAVASFITSLIGLWIAGIPLGIHARRQIDQSQGRKTGRGFATAGIVLGILGVIGSVILVIVLVSAAKPVASEAACIRNALGAKFCGEEAKQYCRGIDSEAGACAAYPSQAKEEEGALKEAEAKGAPKCKDGSFPPCKTSAEEKEREAEPKEPTEEETKAKEAKAAEEAPACKEHETTPADGCKE